MVEAFLVALAVFICVGGAELAGFTMLNRPIVIGPLVGLFLGDLSTGVTVGAALEAVFYGSGKYRWSICGGAWNCYSSRHSVCDHDGKRQWGCTDFGTPNWNFGITD